MVFEKFQSYDGFEVNEISEPAHSVKLQIKGRQLNICGHNMNMHIVHTVFYTIPIGAGERNLFNNQEL